MTTQPAAVDDADIPPEQCWCCDVVDDPVRMVHLGNHPEVALCVGCGHWASKQAWEIEDYGKSGPLVYLRNRFRAARRGVMHRSWHNNRLLGRPLRWLGRRLP